MPHLFPARLTLLLSALACAGLSGAWAVGAEDPPPGARDVLEGLREFYRRTARPDGSFIPGVDPQYHGMSDSAYSDLAAVTYACTIHKTFGWQLPFENETAKFLIARQRKDGAFFNVAGTVDPDSAEGRCYNTTQGLVALHALGRRPRYDPLPVFEAIVKNDYQSLPAYSTSFFPLAYRCYGRPIPALLDRAIRATMKQAEDGYLHDHIAATFHASHYYRLIGEPTPLADKIVARMLRDQKPDGGWLLNMPSRDRHAAFDAVFTLRQEGADRRDCQEAIAQAARWAMTCRNDDGGFGHFPGSPSDADAVYFQVGVLVMAGVLKPVDPLPPEPELFSWGHLMLRQAQLAEPEKDRAEENRRTSANDVCRERPLWRSVVCEPTSPRPSTERHTGRSLQTVSDEPIVAQSSPDAGETPPWIASVRFSPDGKWLATGSADGEARLWDAATGSEIRAFMGHRDVVSSVAFSPDGRSLATGGFDGVARIWDVETGETRHLLAGHRGTVLTVAYRPDGRTLATCGIDGAVRLWDTSTGQERAALAGHKTWVNALAYSPEGDYLASASSDGTLRIWNIADGAAPRIIEADPAEIRSVAWSRDGRLLAVGIRYGRVKVWNTAEWSQRFSIDAHRGDVWSVAFTLDGRQLLTVDGDWDGPGQLKAWDSFTGAPVTGVETPGELLSVAMSPDGGMIAAAGRDGKLHLWGTAEVLQRSK
ncbi:MAG TPA: prenyltransferase/squalene oxidase repeat-containing protein [Pirellulales bacterium]|nr:prenyltransferase/squalene oxidase repeat-containing protein [Pirellulales bacterium]